MSYYNLKRLQYIILKAKLFDRHLFSLSIIVFCVEKFFFLNPNSIYRGKVIDWCGQVLEDALNSQTLDKNTKNSKEVNKNTNSNPFHLFSKKLFTIYFYPFDKRRECQRNLHLNHNLLQSFYIYRNKLQHASFTTTICCICKHFALTTHLDAQHSSTSETHFECK